MGSTAGLREIAPGVHCLGPSGHSQTNVHLLRAGSGWVLIDAGWKGDGPRIEAAASSLTGPGERPGAILLTHVHPDHDGAALQLARAWGCHVWMPQAELPFASGDFAAMRAYAGPLDRWVILPLLRTAGRRRREAILARTSLDEVARVLEPGADLPWLPGWQAIATPGHTPGHVSYFRPADRVLISGDAVLTLRVNAPSGLLLGRSGLSGPPWYTTWSRDMARASVAALARLEPLVLAPGHGPSMAGQGTAAALRRFAAR